ncbi:MAG: insulinase family protein [Deltaproteobacteria bacterium]|nr:insulinase family protein [Deltaproteobacteria bacterium]
MNRWWKTTLTASAALACAVGLRGGEPARAQEAGIGAPVRPPAAERARARTTATTPARPSPLDGLEIRRERLGSGLRVVLNPDRSVPTVGIAVYYDVGSRNEVRGRSGFAHLFEHMMFQGSANVGKGEHFVIITQRGGSMNGTTSDDRTNYYETLPSNELELGLWLEADRMRSLAVTEENFENQREVVMDERRQSYENQPYALSFLRANELSYGDYWPYAHSTIGDMQDLVNAPLTAVQEFWTQYYAPNNAVLSISGDFDADEAMALVHRHFDDIQPRQVPAFAPPQIQPQTAERRDAMVDPLADLPAFHVNWHIPAAREADHYALEMLSLILGHGHSSRLYRDLVHERQLVSEISAGTDDRRGPDLFSVFGLVAEGHTPSEVEPLVFGHLERIGREGVTERELTRVRNQVRSFFLFSLQANLDRARQLAEFEMYWGDANLIRGELDRYLAVTRADVQRVAARYFAETNRSVLDVMPAGASAGGGAP